MTPPVDVFVVECAERHEQGTILLATVDPYQAFALAEAVVARTIDPPEGSRAGDLAHVQVIRFAGLVVMYWQRERARSSDMLVRRDGTRALGVTWWDADTRSRALAVERWSPWYTREQVSDRGWQCVVFSHVDILRNLGERSDLLVTVGERAMDLSRETVAGFAEILERL